MTCQRSPGLWLCLPLLIFTLAGVDELPNANSAPMPHSSTVVTRSNCETSYDGISHCVEDNGNIHVIIIDLENPHIRFEMVMADDVTSVDTTRRERIEDLVQRPPYLEQEVVVAINADYFGQRHGPEGLAVKNGRRLDGEEGRVQNPHAIWRSSLAISRLNRVSLGRKSPEELDDPRAYQEKFYNAVGGGPLILNYGVVIPNVIACLLERFPIGACQRTIQTAAGVSQDGRWLFLMAGKGRDIEGFARLLRDYGAFTAIKLDGGGSSQLWYDGQMRHDTERAVGNALLVFYSPVPRHDARFTGPTDLPVVEPGERVEIDFEIENTGFLDWEPHLGYRFKNVQGWPVLGPAYARLPSLVPAGSTFSSSISVVAPYRPGVYEAEWQLTQRAELIGSRLWFGMVVVPPNSAEIGFSEKVGSRLVLGQTRPESEQEWMILRRELEQEIWREVTEMLRAALDEGGGQFSVVFEALVKERWDLRRRPFPW